MRATGGVRATRVVGAVALVAALTAIGPATATAVGPTCTFNGATGPVTGVVPGGTTIAVTCAGLAADEVVVLNIESPLAGIVEPPSAVPNEAAGGGALLATADASGAFTATYLVPAAFTAHDPAAACPPTQAQVNAGLSTCTVAVRGGSGALVSAPAELVYANQAAPTVSPTLTVVNGASFVPGDTVSLLGTGYWGSPLASTPAVTFGATVADPAPAAPVRISAPTYTCGPDDCATSAGVLTPGILVGSVTVPAVTGDAPATITVRQENTTPFPGNGFLGTLEGSAVVSILGSPLAFASPDHGGVGMPVAVTGTGWDPQGAPPEVSVLTAVPGQTATTTTATVDANGNLSAGLTIGAGDARGVNPILVTQLSAGGLRSAQALFTVDTSASCESGVCSGGQVLDQNIVTGGLSMSEMGEAASFSAVTLTGVAQESTGTLGTITVLDGRGTFDGWQVTVTMAGDFLSDAGTGPNYMIAAGNLRWVPRVGLAAPGSGDLDQVDAGPPGDLSTTSGATLCSAPVGGGGGAFTCDADLYLLVPASIARGTYRATLNITIT